MKKLMVLLFVLVFLGACSSSEGKDNEKDEPTFTEEDIALAKEMIQTAQQLENEFVTAANKKLKKQLEEDPDKYISVDGFTKKFDQKKFNQEFKPLLEEKMLDPFIEKYGTHIVGKEGKEMDARVNVANHSQEEREEGTGKYPRIDERKLFLTYQDLEVKEPKVEDHSQYGVQELIFPINEDRTIPFVGEEGVPLPKQFTFYKTEEGDLLIGEFAFLEGHAYVDNFTADTEDVQEELQELPELK